MSERGIEFKVGLLLVGAMALLVVLVFALGNFSLGAGYVIHVDYAFSGNIQPGAPVKLSGIKVGKIEDVRLLPAEAQPATGERVQVRLDVWLEERVADLVHQDAEFYVNTAGVLGEQYLEIVPGTEATPPLEAGAIVRGVDPPRTDLIVSRLYTVLDSLSIVLTKERDTISRVLRSSAGALGELEALLSQNREELGLLIGSASELTGQAAVTLSEINEGIEPRDIGRAVDNANQLLSSADQTLRELTPEAKALVVDARRVTGLLTEERVDRTLDVADRAVAVGGEAEKLIHNLNEMLLYVRRGKGTVGALLVREEIYADLREMIRDLKRNPWKFFWKE